MIILAERTHRQANPARGPNRWRPSANSVGAILSGVAPAPTAQAGSSQGAKTCLQVLKQVSEPEEPGAYSASRPEAGAFDTPGAEVIGTCARCDAAWGSCMLMSLL